MAQLPGRTVSHLTNHAPDMQPSSKLIDVVLSEFQKTLCNTYHYKWEAKHGKPPSRCYVQHVVNENAPFKRGTPMAAWIVTLDSITTTQIETNLPRPKIDGMFFDLCRGSFSLSPDGKIVFINWQTGPRFGRGFKHSVIEDSEGTVSLGKGAGTWVS